MDKDLYKYQSIGATGVGEYKDKGSKFISFAYHCQTTEEVAQIIEKLKKEHLKARHHCYAYILDRQEKQFRANDDGEPSGTAGKPILGQIKSAQLKEVLVVVVRYFGGTKLGASGLISAYRAAAEEAIKDAKIINVSLQNTYILETDYAEMGKVLNLLKSMEINIQSKVFNQKAEIKITVDCGESQQVLQEFKAKLLHVSTDTINEETSIPYCKIKDLIVYD